MEIMMSDFTPKSAVNYLRCIGNSSMDGNIARSFFGIADLIEQLQQRVGELEEMLSDALDTCPECTSGLTKIKGNIRKCHHCGVESDSNE